jgi:hypothetical protein
LAETKLADWAKKPEILGGRVVVVGKTAVGGTVRCVPRWGGIVPTTGAVGLPTDAVAVVTDADLVPSRIPTSWRVELHAARHRRIAVKAATYDREVTLETVAADEVETAAGST